MEHKKDIANFDEWELEVVILIILLAPLVIEWYIAESMLKLGKIATSERE